MKPLQLRRFALQAIAGSPPTEYDLQTYELCRRTLRSHDNLIAELAQANGNFPNFLVAIGYSKFGKSWLYDIDNRYWYVNCLFIHYFQKTAIRTITTMANDLELPDKQQVMENVAKALGFPVDFLSLFMENRDHIKEYLDAIRTDMGLMAEIKLAQLIAAGDPATIRWVLPRLMPGEYGTRRIDESSDITEIEIIESSNESDNYNSSKTL